MKLTWVRRKAPKVCQAFGREQVQESDSDLANALRAAKAEIAKIIAGLGKGKSNIGVNIAVNENPELLLFRSGIKMGLLRTACAWRSNRRSGYFGVADL